MLPEIYNKLIEFCLNRYPMGHDFNISPDAEEIIVSFDKYKSPINTIVGRVQFYQSDNCGDGCCSWSNNACIDYETISESGEFNNEELTYIREKCGI